MFQDQLQKKVRPFIDLIDDMRSLGIDKELNLPAIVVVGDQSSGKSSVLEALSGVALPRGTGIVTRCPLLLQLCNDQNTVWKAKISYRDQMRGFTEPLEVADYVREAQDKLAGEGDGICEELITLKIMSSTVCDLTLIDLPGIARVPTKGQPQDIAEQIKCLINNYIRREEIIILVVVPCNVDIATTEALQMAQQVDVDGTRTLGILTKPDLIDRGAEKTVLDIVQNQTIPLKLGYVIVKCRGQKQIDDNMSIVDAIEDEKEFFNTHMYFSSLDEKITIGNLSKKLTVTLVEHIKKSLPEISEKIKNMLGDVRNKLNKLRRDHPQDASEKRKCLMKVITDFNEKITQLSNGDTFTRDNLFVLMRKEFTHWMECLTNTEANYSNHVQQVSAEYDEQHRGSELPGFSNYSVFRQVVQKLVGELLKEAIMTVHSVREMLQKQFSKLSKDSFEGYPFLLQFSKRNLERIQDHLTERVTRRIEEQFQMEMLVYTQDKQFNIQNGVDENTTDYTDHDQRHNYPELLKAYYEIVVRRLGDQVPMLIYYFILKEGAKNMCSEMLSLLYKDDIDEVIQEDPNIEINRAKLKAQLDCLLIADDKLSNL
ncbi:hypothetical protein DPEC_G00119240 [Dallia pectoralis]|uniref:Uncharacterized protein n=1 Tax=Dallia pectoralis TaxID=75939 RepID=A0ACC2GPD3_DALPE|nr:hypothetical protein DPEC_G00119240 [Dallia pectoralis]